MAGAGVVGAVTPGAGATPLGFSVAGALGVDVACVPAGAGCDGVGVLGGCAVVAAAGGVSGFVGSGSDGAPGGRTLLISNFGSGGAAFTSVGAETWLD
jgi:hypothetical protein